MCLAFYVLVIKLRPKPPLVLKGVASTVSFVVALIIGFMALAILSTKSPYHNEVLIISVREVTVTRQSVSKKQNCLAK